MKLGLAIVACIAALGCGDRAADQRCRAQTDELTRWLGTLNLEPQIVLAGKERLVRRADLDSRHLVASPVVSIGAELTTYQGSLVDEADLLEDRLTASQRKLADDLERGRFAGPPPDPRQLHLLIDEAAPWERVVAVAVAAHRAGFTRPSFLFTPPPGPSTRPPRTALDDRMDALERDLAEGKTSLAPRSPSESLFERCPAVIRLFGELGEMETGDKVEVLVRRIGPALVDCRCKVDLPAVRSMLWHLLHNANPVRGIAVELGPDAPPIALPASTPWREASTRLTPATGRAWLAIGS